MATVYQARRPVARPTAAPFLSLSLAVGVRDPETGEEHFARV